jgi:hypothetical protein
MKKGLLVLALFAIVTIGTVFADHPDGFGVGVAGRYGIGDIGGFGAGLSLKIPSIPIFWGVNYGFNSDYLGIGITGDYYLIDKALVRETGLNWYMGVGGFFDTLIADDFIVLDIGTRVPIGISWQPVSLLEVFFGIAPSIGFEIVASGTYTGGGIIWGIPVELGFRLWF